MKDRHIRPVLVSNDPMLYCDLVAVVGMSV